MIDLKALEKDPEDFETKLKRRGEIEGLPELLSLSNKRKALVTELQLKQESRNVASKELAGASKEEINQKRSELKELSSA